MWFRQVFMHCSHDFRQGMRPGHFQHFRMYRQDHVVTVTVFFLTQATSDDDFAVFGQGFADGIERLLYSSIDETASIDDDEVGTFVGFGGFIAFCTQLRENLLGIGQGFRATKRDESHFRRNGSFLAAYFSYRHTGCVKRYESESTIVPRHALTCRKNRRFR